MENFHDGHRERLRDKIDKDGVETLQPHEILEFLLYPVIPRRDTNPIAHDLLERFDSLRGIFTAEPAQLMEIDGMSELSALWLQEVGRAVLDYIAAPDDFVPLRSHREAREFAKAAFCTGRTYGSWLFCLNSFGYMIHSLRLDAADEWFARENMQLIISQSLACHANSILLLQHSSKPRLRQEDIRHTERLMNSLAKSQISLVEHLIVDGEGNIVQRLLNPWVGNAAIAETAPLLAHWMDEE